VIDTDTGKESPDKTVVISDGKISDLANSKDVGVPANAPIVDGRGRYLIPGLWDMHVHTWKYESTYPLYIANGVTGVREMFGPPDANAFRTKLASNHLLAPRMYIASPIIDGHPRFWPESIEVADADQARDDVREQKSNGADFIKVYSRLSREAYFAIMDESHRLGLPVDGHVPTRITAWEASDAKRRSFEHLNGIAMACSTREEELQPKLSATTVIRERYSLMAQATRSPKV